MKLVSVIVPTFNRPDGLRRALATIEAQTYRNIETVVVNDAGESVADICNAFRLPLKYAVHRENLGTAAARNTGMALASGDYIAFLDDDDEYRPNHIATLVDAMTPEVVGAYTDAEEIGGRVVYSYDFSFPHLLALNYIPNLCLMVRREIAEQAGGFDVSLPILEDWEWLIRVARLGALKHVPIVTAAYRAGGRNYNTTEMIGEAYRTIYSRYASHATPETIEIQRHVFRDLTGAELVT